MDPKQFDAMLSDAEVRLRRLKVLYDQWFMGIERTEPFIPKKELEDLLVRLKREQVNNTAAKFRLREIVQRHVTFTTYWRRIARQIEEGTFKRDLVRARKYKKRNADDDDAELNYEIDVELDLDMEMDMDAALAEARDASERAAHTVPAPEPKAEPKAVPPMAAANTDAAVPPIAAAARIAIPGVAPKLAPPPPVGAVASAVAQGKPPLPPTAAGVKPAAPATAASATAAKVAAAVAAAKPPVAAPVILSSPRPQPLAAGTSNKPQPTAASASGKPQSSILQSVKPQLATHSGKPQPILSAKPPAGGQSKAPGGATEKNGAKSVLSSEDVQRIYSNYVAARKQNAERVDNVKFDNIEKTLRGMLPQLEKKHAGKKIDFEVVVKDGKVALKPVAK